MLFCVGQILGSFVEFKLHKRILNEDEVIQKLGFSTGSLLSTILAIILMVSGMMLVFDGKGSEAQNRFVAGFLSFAAVGVFVLNFLNSRNILNNRELTNFLLLLGVSMAAGILLLIWEKPSKFLVGGLFGLIAYLLVFQFTKTRNLIVVDTTRIVVIGSMCFIFAVLALYFRPVFLLSKSTVGSFCLFVGIDYFVKSGFGAIVYNSVYLLNPIKYTGKTYGMLGGFIALSIFGVFLRFRDDIAVQQFNLHYKETIDSLPR